MKLIIHFRAGNAIWLLGVLICSALALFQKRMLTKAEYPCWTPYDTYGRCVPSHQCEFLQILFKQYGLSLPQQYRRDVQKARCFGPKNDQIYLCCDNSTRNRSATLQLNAQGLSILRSQKCGVFSEKIVSGGTVADLFEFPWLALLRYDDASQPYRCGGSLITNRHVLTAAHCVVGEKILDIRLGEYNFATDPDCDTNLLDKICAEPVADYGIEGIISHPEFSVAYKSNDVALIKLDRVVQFKDHIQPICLPITEAAAQLPKDGSFYVAGWGLTHTGNIPDILQKVILPFMSQSECRSFFPLTPLTNNHICAGGVGIMDACQGDSGGPLFNVAPYNRSYRYVQYGIVSFGNNECGTGESRPAIYANVINYMTWITENLN